MEIIIGLILVTIAGFGTGAGAWPFKVIKDFRLEQYLFFNAFFSFGIYPWLIFLVMIPAPLEVIQFVGYKTLLLSNLLSLGWGVANVLYMLCVVRIGAALTGAILPALGMSAGVILPMVLKGSGLFAYAPGLFSKPGILIMIGLVIIIAGVVLVSVAGFGREKVLNIESEQIRKKRASGNFRQGLLLVILAGILSCGLALAFVYAQGPIIEAVKKQGGSGITANIVVWALVGLGGLFMNLGYAVSLMTRNKTSGLIFKRKFEFIFGAVAGLQFIVSTILMGRGMILIGILGASVGFGVQQSMQIAGNQVVGFLGGEWKGVTGRPRRTMYLALMVIFLAVVVFAYSNTTI